MSVGRILVFYLVLGPLFAAALLLLGGCSASGELPQCVSGCTMTKSWGIS